MAKPEAAIAVFAAKDAIPRGIAASRGRLRAEVNSNFMAVLEMLVAYGCDGAQGHFFSRPCAAEELSAWLSDSPYRAPAGVRSVSAG